MVVPNILQIRGRKSIIALANPIETLLLVPVNTCAFVFVDVRTLNVIVVPAIPVIELIFNMLPF
jgi:hypothetical protein